VTGSWLWLSESVLVMGSGQLHPSRTRRWLRRKSEAVGAAVADADPDADGVAAVGAAGADADASWMNRIQALG